MFGLRKKAPVNLLLSNPGRGVAGEVGFSNADKTWSEHYNLVALMASVLGDHGHRVDRKESYVVLKDSGFILLPQFVHVQPLEKGGVRTTTTLQTNHPLLVPEGVFEYQHATGNNVEDSFRKGFDQWAQTDLVTLVEAAQAKPLTSTTLKMNFPDTDGRPAHSRRAVLGPVTHFVENAQIDAEQKMPISEGDVEAEQCENHEFCPCCLLTKSFETFKELIEGTAFYGLRLFAARDGEGVPQADCRVNGDDWEAGAEALRKYVTTWPGTGYEFRKQYVVLHTIENES